ncbi:UDP-3-O-glucosamine N-acyltransferase [Thelephora terrestris]|uniref:Translation initiation factor eIF2B subunit gamma n=1 Tax=Thelephora terrestris TaxID=56493 RepID=A0A9P6HQN5_9AGAM|nr:UDP-3-O-glucosamine N-acyltransferase [Thelephora terrestris]
MDFEASQPIVKSEFIAVVLAGFGRELQPLTSNHGDEPCPKALLPIGNKPMIDHVLAWLEPSGITDVLLVCPTPHRRSIADHVGSDASASFPSLRIDLQTYGDPQDSSFGTGSILRTFAHRIDRDFVVLPCDFIPPPSLQLTTVLNKFRMESASDGSILTSTWYEAPPQADKPSGDEWGPHASPTSIVWDERSESLLQIEVPDSIARKTDDIEIEMSLLSMYPRLKLTNKLQDSNVFVCHRSVLELLRKKRRLESLGKGFLPWLCKINHRRSKKQAYKTLLQPYRKMPTLANALKNSTLNEPGTVTYKEEDDGRITTNHGPSTRVGLIVHKAGDGIAARASNLYNYLDINRRFLEQASQNQTGPPAKVPLVDAKAQISVDSSIGQSTRVEERAVIKKSVVGRHCVIGKMAKIVGCVILDHCVVEDGAKLEGCILGGSTKVGAKAELLKCVTQAGFEVDAGGHYRNAKLEISDWTTAGAYDDEESDEDEESGEESDDV